MELECPHIVITAARATVSIAGSSRELSQTTVE